MCGYNTAKRKKWEGMGNIQKDNNKKFLTPEELSARWKGETLSTLANKRSQGKGPKYYKLPKILYSLDDIEDYEEKHRVGNNL